MISCGDDEAYVVIKGDTNGDGYVNSTDYLQIKGYFLGTYQFDKIYFLAADTQDDGQINSTDYLQIKGYFLETYNLYPEQEIIPTPPSETDPFTITFVNDDGTLLKTTKCVAGEIPSFGNETPAKKSDSEYTYIFDRWEPELEAATEDTTYVAIYEKEPRTSYTISYDANGGSNAPLSHVKPKGISATLRANIPTNSGNIFMGWRCVNDGNIYKSGASFNIDADVTLYAVWGHDCFDCNSQGTITSLQNCRSCSGSGQKSQTTYSEKDCPSCSGGNIIYSTACSTCRGFGGNALCECSCGNRWWANQTGSRKCSRCGTTVASTIHGSCSTCGGSGTVTGSKKCSGCQGNGFIISPTTTLITCSSCNGGGSKYYTDICSFCNGEKAVSNQYNSYNVTLINGGSTIGTASVMLNSPYKFAIPTKNGYKFLGWFDSVDNGIQYTDSDGISLSVWSLAENKTLYARWSLNYYTITYDCDNNVNINNMPSIYTVEDECVALNGNEQLREGYSGFKWEFDSNAIDFIDTSLAEDLVIKGVWIPEKYIVSFDANGGIVYVSSQTVIYDSVYNLPTPTRADYIFLGWYNGNTEFSGGIWKTTSNISLTAEWMPLSDFGYTVSETYVSITKYSGQRASLRIPTSINGKTVNCIGDGAFKDCTWLTSITIPDSVTSIGKDAFSGCAGLLSIEVEGGNTVYHSAGNCLIETQSKILIAGCKNSVIPKDGSVTSIGRDAFEGCTSLVSITIPDGITFIGGHAFKDCTGLLSITIPDSVTSIGYSAFKECTSIESMTLPFVGENKSSELAFPSDKHLGRIFGAYWDYEIGKYVPSSLKTVIITGGEISDSAFWDCSSLTSITIPDSVTSIGDSAFNGCSSLTSINIPDSVTSIGDFTFYGCSKLTSITIPDGVISIGDSAFDGCSKLTSINIPDGVTSIGEDAFSGCTSLTSIIIPDGVTSIGEDAFSGCSKLTSINIPDGVTSIGDSAFNGCSKLTSIIIPDGVTSIGDYVFSGCTSLTSIIIPDGVTSIGASAFFGCYSLGSVNITDILSWNNIDFYGFYSNSLSFAGYLYLNGELVVELAILDSVTYIGDYVFSGCTSFTSITIPDSVTTIGDCVFSGCTSLTSITIPDSVSYIGDSAFSRCSKLTSINIPDGVTSIGDSAFKYCASLTSITIPDSVTTIGIAAFMYCSSLTSITIPDSVTFIGGAAFKYCASLTSITIPDSVTFIGDSAFYGCNKLARIDYNGTISQWNSINKGSEWNDSTGNYEVYCTDGTLSK